MLLGNGSRPDGLAMMRLSRYRILRTLAQTLMPRGSLLQRLLPIALKYGLAMNAFVWRRICRHLGELVVHSVFDWFWKCSVVKYCDVNVVGH